MEQSQSLTKINQARQALAEAKDLYDILDIRDKAKAVAVLAEAQGAGEAANEAKEIQLRAERKAGEFLKEVPRGGGTRTDTSLHDATKYQQAIEYAGIERTQAHRWQKSAEIPPDVFDEYIERTKANGKELTATGVHRLATGIHISDGSDDWNTPKEIIELARELFGVIDLDPASSNEAQAVVRADVYFTPEDNGLTKGWFGNVWLNPPYSTPSVDNFVAKAIEEYTGRNVEEMLVLVNNATETRWFQSLLELYPVCFLSKRLRFWRTDRPSLGTRQGQALFYLGKRPQAFAEIFSKQGLVMVTYDY